MRSRQKHFVLQPESNCELCCQDN